MEKIRTFVSNAKEGGLYPPMFVTAGLSSEPRVMVEGREVVSFASANYLGLANDQRVKKAVVDGIERYGLHPCGSRCVSGSLDVHRELEQRTARHKGLDDALLFPTGMMANMGTIPAIVDMPLRGVSALLRRGPDPRNNVVFSDELNHASIIDGYSLSHAQIVTYRHNDIEDLAAKMAQYRDCRGLIVTDGVFSMDGDIAPLPDIVELARRHEAMVMVDDAHASGVLGEQGRGTLEHFGMHDGVDINMGTYSKAFGISGGFVAGEQALIDYLRVAARTYMFSGATFGSLALGAMAALEIARDEPQRRHRLWALSKRLRDGLAAQGLDVLGRGETPIVPVLVGDEETAQGIAHDLFGAGFFAPCIMYPAVQKKRSRIRFSLTCLHTEQWVDELVEAMAYICERRGALMAA